MRAHKLLSVLSTLAITLSLTAPVNAATPGAQTSTEKITSAASSKHRPRVGLALGGGGSRGSAHVGVLKVLLQEGVPIDLIAGTSIGSVVGGFYAAGVSVDEMQAQFDNDTFIKEFMPMPLVVRLALAPIIFVPRLVGYHPYDGLYKGAKFRKYAAKLSGHSNIEDLSIPFSAVCTNVVDGSSCRINKGDLGTALQASTAVPGLKKPVQIGDKLYCDGGLICNLPTKHVREMGADFVIAVNIDEYLPDVPLKIFRKVGSMSRQALRVQLNAQDDPCGKEADIYLHPDTTGITFISIKKSDGRRGYEAGVKAAQDAMPEIKKKLLALGIALQPAASQVSSNSASSVK